MKFQTNLNYDKKSFVKWIPEQMSSIRKKRVIMVDHGGPSEAGDCSHPPPTAHRDDAIFAVAGGTGKTTTGGLSQPSKGIPSLVSHLRHLRWKPRVVIMTTRGFQWTLLNKMWHRQKNYHDQDKNALWRFTVWGLNLICNSQQEVRLKGKTRSKSTNTVLTLTTVSITETEMSSNCRTKILSLAAPKVFILTTCCVANEEHFLNLTTFPLQWYFRWSQWRKFRQ